MLGPMRYKGLYHMFYQHNPKAAVWSNNSIEWGHSVSKDLVNWFPLQPALTPTEPYMISMVVGQVQPPFSLVLNHSFYTLALTSSNTKLKI